MVPSPGSEQYKNRLSADVDIAVIQHCLPALMGDKEVAGRLSLRAGGQGPTSDCQVK